ncbi:MAG: hypothetical protein H7Y17_07900 [Chlorobia bacterium]|nr:hypothetical protein [Fimbriimonadaceae bacterium]
MTNEKAREYFSAYSEGTLDAGLAQSFEAKMKADVNLRDEYAQFETTLKELESLRFEQIEVPFELNDRISAAIDKSIYDKKRSAQPGWSLWLRNLAFGGLACAAVFGAYLSINMASGPGPSLGGPGPVSPDINRPKTIEQIEYSPTPGGVKMNYQPTDKHTVVIRGGSEGEQTYEVDSNGWINEIKNDQPSAAMFIVEVKGEIPPTIVIVPGSTRKDSSDNQGSLTELAMVIADKYGVSVVVKSQQAESEMSWTLTEDDARKATQGALQNMPFVVDIRKGILYIGDN